MRQRDWFLKGVLTAIAVGLWVLILKPALAPTRAAEEQQAAQRELRAQRFVLVDNKGTERAVLGVTDEGQGTFLQMYDARGARALRLGDATDRNKGKLVHRALLLMREDGKQPVAGLEYLPDDGQAALKLRGRDDARADLVIGTRPNGAAAEFGLQGKDGGSAMLQVTPEGTAELRLTNKDGGVFTRAPEAASPRRAANTPMGVAHLYFADLADGKVEDAERLAAFENDQLKGEWEKQANAYAARLKAGGRKWWGDPISAQEVHGPPPGKWAYLEVQWRYLAGLGWMMAQHYTYKMRTIDGQWRIVISRDLVEQGVPLVHSDEVPR